MSRWIAFPTVMLLLAYAPAQAIWDLLSTNRVVVFATVKAVGSLLRWVVTA